MVLEHHDRVPNGTHVLTAVARDAAGNSTHRRPRVTVTVNERSRSNRAPTLAQPANQTSGEGSPASADVLSGVGSGRQPD